MGIRPLNCCSLHRRCASSLICTYLKQPAHKFFTTSIPNFKQCAGGLSDGASRAATLIADDAFLQDNLPRVLHTLADAIQSFRTDADLEMQPAKLKIHMKGVSLQRARDLIAECIDKTTHSRAFVC